MPRYRRLAVTLAGACALLLLALGAVDARSRSATSAAEGTIEDPPSFDLGKQIFFTETFDGNGRTCGTCHLTAAQFSITPALVEAEFQRDPGSPLFRAIDSDAGDGQSYEILRRNALFVVNIPLHPNIWLADDPGQRCIQVRRQAPTIANVGLTAPLLLDGRAGNLVDQGAGAVDDHFEARRKPTANELLSLQKFQQQIFSPQRVAALLGDFQPVPEQADFSVPSPSPAARRGRLEFDVFCASCHGGEMRNKPLDPGTTRFQRVFISELNAAGLPVRPYVFLDREGIGFPRGRQIQPRNLVEDSCRTFFFPALTGGEEVFLTPDPGRAATTGRFEDLNTFEIPTLRGIQHTAPYFHDNSVPTLEDVVEHYNRTFGFGITGRPLNDLVAFLESL